MSDDLIARLRSPEETVFPAGTEIAGCGGTIKTLEPFSMWSSSSDKLEAAEEIERLRAELERRTRNHRKLLQGLARGDYEIVYASDEGEVVAIFPVALYEDCQSDPALDQRLIDLILNDPLVKRSGISLPQQEGREEQQRKIWRARLAQMRRVGIVISEAKP